jgi:nicotinamide mononucleotide (NMN) deamidase PncC
VTEDVAHGVGDHLDGRTVAVAESCTGGLVACALAAAPGSGTWFRGALVAYQRDVKFELLGVTPGPVVSTRAGRTTVREYRIDGPPPTVQQEACARALRDLEAAVAKRARA